MGELTTVQTVTVWVLPVLFAITLHEVAHGWVASFFGDQTARLSGRLSLNPIKHIDVIGTLVVPLLLLLFSNFIFGWAKPVPVDARNLHHPRRDMAIVALAGPIANLCMAIAWALLAKIGIYYLSIGNLQLGEPLTRMGYAGIQINILLAVLNFIPIPPLDGYRIVSGFLPGRMAWQLSFLEPYSFMILLLLMLSGVLFYVINPIASALMQHIIWFVGLAN